MDFKYIVIEVMAEQQKVRIPIIFPAILVHSDVDKYIKAIKGFRDAFPHAETVSAGTVRLEALWCGEKSETLKLESLGQQDTELINTWPYMHGLQ